MRNIKNYFKELVIEKKKEFTKFWKMNWKNKVKTLAKKFLIRLVITAIVALTLSHFGISPVVEFAIDINVNSASISIN